jgi:hypothetical protein
MGREELLSQTQLITKVMTEAEMRMAYEVAVMLTMKPFNPIKT